MFHECQRTSRRELWSRCFPVGETSWSRCVSYRDRDVPPTATGAVSGQGCPSYCTAAGRRDLLVSILPGRRDLWSRCVSYRDKDVPPTATGAVSGQGCPSYCNRCSIGTGMSLLLQQRQVWYRDRDVPPTAQQPVGETSWSRCCINHLAEFTTSRCDGRKDASRPSLAILFFIRSLF